LPSWPEGDLAKREAVAAKPATAKNHAHNELNNLKGRIEGEKKARHDEKYPKDASSTILTLVSPKLIQ